MKHAFLPRLLASALAALLPWLALAQAPDLRSPTAYLPADQARFQTDAAGPAAGPAAGTHRLRPGVAVFGWVPYWVPASYLRQVDFKLLSHVAYEGYQATEAGALQAPPTGDAGPLAGLVHQANPQCKVLLSVCYQQEAAGGAALFGAAGQPARQALAQAVARQVSALGADGVHLELAFGPQPATADPAPRPGTKSELASTKKRLNQTLDDLNDRKKQLDQLGDGLQHTRTDFAKRRKKGKNVTASELGQYDRAQRQHQADSAQFYKERAQFRAERDALKQNKVLPGAGVAADGRPAAVRELVAALRQALPQATLTVGLPAHDSSRVYAGALAAGPLATLYVLHAADYTAGRGGEPGPLAPWQPSGASGPQAVAASVEYYRQQGVAPAQLLLGLSAVAKVWSLYSPAGEMPAEGAPVHYWYATSRSLAGWPPRSAQSDAASGSHRLALPPPPDSVRGSLLSVPYLAWADDSASLGAHYEWVRAQGLGGVGIWALGFDAPDAPLWSSLRAHLAVAASSSPARAVPDTIAQATPIARPRQDTAAAADDSLLPVGSTAQAEKWAHDSKLPTVALLALALLVAGAWVGMVVGAARTARQWVPFGRRLTWVLVLLLGVAALLGGYVSLLGIFSAGALWVAWVSALALLGIGWLAYRQARPAYPLP